MSSSIRVPVINRRKIWGLMPKPSRKAICTTNQGVLFIIVTTYQDAQLLISINKLEKQIVRHHKNLMGHYQRHISKVQSTINPKLKAPLKNDSNLYIVWYLMILCDLQWCDCHFIHQNDQCDYYVSNKNFTPIIIFYINITAFLAPYL